MNTLEIWNAMTTNKYTKKIFKGVFPLDEIPKTILKRPAGIIVNTDKSTQPGTHWIALYLPVKDRAEFFDSYGRAPMHNEFLEFFIKNKIKKILYNKTQLQSVFSAVCGQYCCFYLLARSNNCSLKKFKNKFFKNQNLIQNDTNIKRLFYNHFENLSNKKQNGRGCKSKIKQVQTCRGLNCRRNNY